MKTRTQKKTQKRTQKRTQNSKRTQKRKGGGLFYRYTLTKLADKWNKKSKRLVKKNWIESGPIHH